LTQPRPLADVEDERIVKRGTRVVRCANPDLHPSGPQPVVLQQHSGGDHTVSQTRRGKSSCRHPMCWAVRSTASKPWSSAPTSWSRSAETPSASRSSPRRAVAQRAPGAAQRERRCLPL